MDLRRVPPRMVDDASDPVLIEAIRDEIRRDGPMTFARFMEIALYHPARGYYRSSVARPGRAGDFVTAPELHPIFGRAIARFATAVHEALGAPEPYVIRESGAGTGALAEPLVAGLRPRQIRYLVNEVEPSRVESIRARLTAAIGDEAHVEVVADDGRPIEGLAIANEVVDALPFHRVVQRGGALREVLVGLDAEERPTDVEAEPSTPEIERRLRQEGIVLVDGQQAEIAVDIDAWVERAAAGLARGALLLIDYGYPATELYDPSRRFAGTLATYHGHQVGDDPYRAIGRQDLTAHVDFTAVEAAAHRAGLTVLGTTTQDRFLARLGIGDLLVAEQTRPGATMPAYLEARASLIRMIDPAAMGRFRVLVLGRGIPADVDLPGLSPLAGGEPPSAR